MNITIADLPLLSAAPAGGATQDPGQSMVSTIVMFALVFAVFYFLIIRPQNKKQKALKKMLADIKRGDKVQTIGGLRGTVQEVKEKEDTIILKVDDSTSLEFIRSAIASVVEQKAVKSDADSTDVPVETAKK